MLRTAQLRQIVDDVVSADVPGFVSHRAGTYVRTVDHDIAQVLEVVAWKGGRYSFRWGVSLSYVPSRLSLPLRFHRTEKRARVDLWEDHFSTRFPDDAYFSELAPSEEAARRAVTRAWKWTKPRAHSWWASATTLAGIAELAACQDAPLHDPEPELVRTLTLARIGSDVDEDVRALVPALSAQERDALSAAVEAAR